MAIYRSARVYAKHDWNNVKIVILQATNEKMWKRLIKLKLKKEFTVAACILSSFSKLCSKLPFTTKYNTDYQITQMTWIANSCGLGCYSQLHIMYIDGTSYIHTFHYWFLHFRDKVWYFDIFDGLCQGKHIFITFWFFYILYPCLPL